MVDVRFVPRMFGGFADLLGGDACGDGKGDGKVDCESVCIKCVQVPAGSHVDIPLDLSNLSTTTTTTTNTNTNTTTPTTTPTFLRVACLCNDIAVSLNGAPVARTHTLDARLEAEVTAAAAPVPVVMRLDNRFSRFTAKTVHYCVYHR